MKFVKALKSYIVEAGSASHAKLLYASRFNASTPQRLNTFQ